MPNIASRMNFVFRLEETNSEESDQNGIKLDPHGLEWVVITITLLGALDVLGETFEKSVPLIFC